jgi:hypothetical protein
MLHQSLEHRWTKENRMHFSETMLETLQDRAAIHEPRS